MKKITRVITLTITTTAIFPDDVKMKSKEEIEEILKNVIREKCSFDKLKVNKIKDSVRKVKNND